MRLVVDIKFEKYKKDDVLVGQSCFGGGCIYHSLSFACRWLLFLVAIV